MATTVQVLYWHDIPVQVRARGAGGRAGVQLAARFQEAVDQAAMAVGAIVDDAYTAGFRWGDPAPHEGSPEQAAAEVAAAIEDRFSAVDWRATVETIRQTRTPGG